MLKDLDTSVFIVWHMSPDIKGVLPQIPNRENALHAAHTCDGETIKTNRIDIAPPDHHLLVEEGRVRVTREPKENRFRPVAFSIGQSNVAAIKNYIANQKAHHRKQTFQNEYRVLLQKHEIDYDERYVWD